MITPDLIRRLRRQRRWLIITGIPLSGLLAGVGGAHSVLGAVFGAIAMWVAMKVGDLCKHDPILDD